MNLSKKTIKHMVSILENNYEERPVKNISTRSFIMNNSSRYGTFSVFFNDKKGLFFGMKLRDGENGCKIVYDIFDIRSPEQLTDL